MLFKPFGEPVCVEYHSPWENICGRIHFTLRYCYCNCWSCLLGHSDYTLCCIFTSRLAKSFGLMWFNVCVFNITVSWDKILRLMSALLPLHALNRIAGHIAFHWSYHVSFSPGQSGSWEHLLLPITEHPATAMVKVNTTSVMLKGGKIGLCHWANIGQLCTHVIIIPSPSVLTLTIILHWMSVGTDGIILQKCSIRFKALSLSNRIRWNKSRGLSVGSKHELSSVGFR